MLIVEPGLLAHALDVLAARADDQPDFFRSCTLIEMICGAKSEMSLRGWCDRAIMMPRMCRRPSRACPRAFVRISRADALDLDVHLQGGDAASGAADLEVHVAEVVFLAEDVAQDDELVALLHQAHGDARDGRLACARRRSGG